MIHIPPALRQEWGKVISDDIQRQSNMSAQRPYSYAYMGTSTAGDALTNITGHGKDKAAALAREKKVRSGWSMNTNTCVF